MKFFILFTLLSGNLLAETLLLDRYDQLKLAELLARIPNLAKHLEVEKGGEAEKRFMTFPKAAKEFQIHCESTYYQDSPYASAAECRVDVDLNAKGIKRGYDELLIELSHRNAEALFEAIPQGREKRELRSWQRDAGINFEGRRSEIFRYYISCLKDTCRIRVSEKGLR